MAELLLLSVTVCVGISPCTIGKHIMLQRYLVNGREILKQKIIDDKLLLEKYGIVPGFKFTVVQDVFGPGSTRLRRIKTGEKEVPMVVLEILKENATNYYVRHLSYEKMLKTSSCSLCLPDSSTKPAGGSDYILDLLCCYSCCHGKDGVNSGEPMLRVKYTNEAGNIGFLGVAKLVWHINNLEKKRSNIKMASSLSTSLNESSATPPLNVEMTRSNNKNAESDNVKLVEKNVQEYSPDQDIDDENNKPQRGSFVTVESMFCHKCGTRKITAEQKFCCVCGEQFI